jgi:MFS family permease
MYQVGGWLGLVRIRPQPRTAAATVPLPRNVWSLGFTSLFTDISSEIVASVLPIYLIGFLRMSPAQFGVMDGLYQGVAGVVQLASATMTDRLRRYKEAAAVGYGVSLLCRIGLLATSGAVGVSAFLTLDRLGKGVRTAPRDALISLSVPPERLGVAFGVHRAMDAVGAMAGPITAYLILRWIPNGFDAVFVVSLCAAVIGFAVLILLVDNKRPVRAPDLPMITLPGLLSQSPAFRHLALSALFLGAMTISDSFIYLSLQKRGSLSPSTIPLLYVMTSAGYLLFAIPIGKLADRTGRFPIFLGGYALLIGLYAALIVAPDGLAVVWGGLLLLGLFYAATDGVLMALGSVLLPESRRASGLALLVTGLVVARFAGSVVFGFAWSRFGLERTITGFLIGLLVAIGLVAFSRPRQALI